MWDSSDAMPYPGGLLSRLEYDKWNALRKKDASRWLSLCCNRFLLRLPYTTDQRNTPGLAESIQHHNDYLWGEPIWLLASRISEAVASRLPQLCSSSLSANVLGAEIGKIVQQLLINSGAGAAVSVEIQEESDKAGKRQLNLRVHTDKQLVNGTEVQLSFFI